MTIADRRSGIVPESYSAAHCGIGEERVSCNSPHAWCNLLLMNLVAFWCPDFVIEVILYAGAHGVKRDDNDEV